MEMKTISEIWTGSIADDYKEGRITTERTLQADLYRFIRQEIPEISIFIEPGMMYYDKGGPRFLPDIVLCEDDTISLIAEIKFSPHWYPEYTGDVKKLRNISENGLDIKHNFEINPMNGEYNDKTHKISDETQYAFFVIGQNDSEALSKESMESIIGVELFNEHFWLYYGSIKADQQAEFGCKKRGTPIT